MGDLSAQAIFDSDTATLPHPIHQTITTPQASRKRGDWGFKRPLPLRSTTKTSTPLIRVEAIDTFEHVTEFGSSADHSITLQKWQEMGVPLSTPVTKTNTGLYDGQERKSVFEVDIDSIAEANGGVLGREDTRWKFKGPWLAGQTEGDFNHFILTEVRKRKADFQKYLRTACAKALTTEARQAAVGEMPPAIDESEITEQQFTAFVKTLRTSRSELYKLIRNFLDLPPAPSRNVEITEALLNAAGAGSLSQSLNNDLPISLSPYADTGPPKTHPSAGLAYSLTNAYTYNHPVWGPQKQQRPVQARVVMPKGASTGNFGAKLGVGGFVTDVPAGNESFDIAGSGRRGGRVARESLIPGLQNIEPEKVGGSKAWVHPTHARIDPKGRVILSVETGDPESVAVQEGTTDQIPKVEPPKLTSRGLGKSNFRGFAERRLEGSSRGYGLDLNGSERQSVPRSRATPRKQDSPLDQLTGLF